MRLRSYLNGTLVGATIYLVLAVFQTVLQGTRLFPPSLLEFMSREGLTALLCNANACYELTSLKTHLILLIVAGLMGLLVVALKNILTRKPQLEEITESRSLIKRY